MLSRIRSALPRPCRLFLALVAIDAVLFSLLRLAFHLRFAPATNGPSAAILSEAFRIGVKFDVRLAILAALPLLMLGGIRALSPFGGPHRLRA